MIILVYLLLNKSDFFVFFSYFYLEASGNQKSCEQFCEVSFICHVLMIDITFFTLWKKKIKLQLDYATSHRLQLAFFIN
jgi:hypothetical protein